MAIQPIQVLSLTDWFDGEDILPGFASAVQDLFSC